MSRNWEKYVEKRYQAQKNLAILLNYQGAQIPDWFNPKTKKEFRLTWMERTDEATGSAVLKRDAEHTLLGTNDHKTIVVIYVPSPRDKAKISKATVDTYVVAFLRYVQGNAPLEDILQATEVIPGRGCILISDVPFDGSARNSIEEFNALLELPIRYFTIDDLQMDPTQHKTGPKSAEVLSDEELLDYFESQRDPHFNRRLNDIAKEYDKIEFFKKSNAEIKSKIPTINTLDPWVKWRGYKVGDVIRFTRRHGQTKVTYRHVIRVEPGETKVVKVKVKKTTK